ncbi:ABC transporter membrane-spanning protein [Terrabacter aerolatus]|uniref:ABC transporter membrane-spanning protein n=1 Tax=Terrabacter aerolatus TaxID=422442 RepID=A0A512CZM6_9MICO|nr:polyketide antibiotic transporter [Terrabacter aerolatus]GEO29661.1 ABC transporter membrane-spanning protein [Terrabacter aerolatus]
MTTLTAPAHPPAGSTSRLAGSGLTGTTSLLRLAARRDRVLVPVSAAGLAAFVALSAQATFELFPDLRTPQASMAPTLSNPALVAMYGPISSLGIDSIATFKSVLLGGVFLALLAYVVVRRHTRTEEEAGRLELLGAGVVGRRAALTAAVLLGTVAVVLTVVLTVGWSIAVGLDPAGSVALGVTWLVIGLAWVGVTAVAAQLTSSTRGTAGWSLGALAVAFLVRAVGDTASTDSPARFLSWITPLGWGVKVSPFGENRYWVVVLGLVLYAVLVVAAYALLDRRDLGAGVLPSRAGAERSTIASPGALTLRLARGTLVGWLVAYVVLGVVLGSIAGSVETFVDSPQVADMLRAMGGAAGSVTDLFFSTELHFAAIGASALAIALVTRMHTEEVSGRLEAVLATPVRRTTWALGHLGVAVLGSAVVMVVSAVVAGLVHGSDAGDVSGTVTRLTGAGLSTLPAVWVALAVAMLLYGALPRFTGLAWAVLIVFLLLGEFGQLLDLPGWLVDLSPFTHLPALPGGALEWAPLATLTCLATAVGGVGLAALRRRDVAA